MTKKQPTKSASSTSGPTISLRHQRFSGFDIYSVLINKKERMLFHRPEGTPTIIADTFKVLGANGGVWLCENIKEGTIHIGDHTTFNPTNTGDKNQADLVDNVPEEIPEQTGNID